MIIRIAIIGCGRVAQHYKKIFDSGVVSNWKVVGCCDVIKTRAKDFAQHFNSRSYENFESVTPAEPYTYRIATQALIDEIASQTQALYGYNPGTTSFLPPPEKAEKEMYKLDYYINENHRLEYV